MQHKEFHKQTKLETVEKVRAGSGEKPQKPSDKPKKITNGEPRVLENTKEDSAPVGNKAKAYNTRSKNKKLSFSEAPALSDFEEDFAESDSDYDPSGNEAARSDSEEDNVEEAPKTQNEIAESPKCVVDDVQNNSVPGWIVMKVDTVNASGNQNTDDNVGKTTQMLKSGVDFLCMQCYGVFKDMESVTQHMLVSHNKMPEFNCVLCSEQFDDYQLLRQHFDSKHMRIRNRQPEPVEDDHSFACKECHRTFASEKSLEMHTRRFHDSDIFIECKRCKHKVHKLYFRKHMWDCPQRIEEEKLKCETCGKVCKTRSSLYYHIKRAHSNKIHECKVCHRKFKDPKFVRVCEDKHANNRRYKCNVCPKAFFYAASLQAHVRYHTGQKPYHCWICERNFFGHQTLLKHCHSHGLNAAQFREEYRKRTGRRY